MSIIRRNNKWHNIAQPLTTVSDGIDTQGTTGSSDIGTSVLLTPEQIKETIYASPTVSSVVTSLKANVAVAKANGMLPVYIAAGIAFAGIVILIIKR